MSLTVSKGKKVKVEYRGKFPDGTVFDEADRERPLEFTVGNGEIVQGFERELEGLGLNEEKTFTLEGEREYGDPARGSVRRFPRSALPQGFEARPGAIVQLQRTDGSSVPATVVEVTRREVTVNTAHPLAGKDITFEVKVLDIR